MADRDYRRRFEAWLLRWQGRLDMPEVDRVIGVLRGSIGGSRPGRRRFDHRGSRRRSSIGTGHRCSLAIASMPNLVARVDQLGSHLVELVADLGHLGAQLVDLDCLLGDRGIAMQQLDLDSRCSLFGGNTSLLGPFDVAAQIGRRRLGIG